MSADESVKRNRKDSESSFANKREKSINYILKDKSSYAVIQNSSFKASASEKDLKEDTLSEVSVIINLENDHIFRRNEKRSDIAFQKTVKEFNSSKLSNSFNRSISSIEKSFNSFVSLTSQKTKKNKSENKQGY